MLIPNKQFLLRWRVWVLAALLMGFGTLTVFEPILHAHELDPTHTEENCAPCNWSKNHVSANLDTPDIAVFEIVLGNLMVPDSTLSSFSPHATSSRSPPSPLTY